jgi:MFS family permease
MTSVFFLTKQDEPEYIITEKRYRFREFISALSNSNFGVFTSYMIAMNLAVQVAAPFFTPYLLNELKFDYLTFTIVTATSMIVKFLFMPGWGKIIDKFGARIVLKFTGYIIPIIPLLWLFGSNIYYLLGIQVLSGLVWGGFELATINFMFDSTPYEKRAAMIAYFNVLYGISNILGTLTGSMIASFPIIGSGYLQVFLVSGILRFMIPLFFVHKIKEERKVPNLGYDKLIFKILTIRPTRGMILNIIPIPRRLHKKRLNKKVESMKGLLNRKKGL